VNLLLVDDRPQNLFALHAVLDEVPGYRLVDASSGAEALDRTACEDFALILLDVAMPEMSGFDVADQLKKDARTRSVPILFLTAVATGLDEIYRAYKIGAVDYHIKPLNVEAVRSKVAVFADLYRQRREVERRDERVRATERREHELRIAELRLASDERYRKLVEGIAHAFAWTADRDGNRLSFVSRRASDLLGYPAEAFSRDGFLLEHVHPEDRGAILRAFAAVAGLGHDLVANHRLVSKDGAVRWYQTAISRGVDPGTHDVVLHGLSTDVTDLKAAEERQRRLANENARLFEHAARAAQARQDLLQLVSNDLRNPLGSVIAGINSACAVLSEDPARARRMLETALRNAKTTTRLVDDLIDRELAQVGRLALKKAPCDVPALLQDAVAMVEPRAREKEVDVRIEPDAAPGTTIECDRDRVLQILSNLLGNAIKFSPRGGSVVLGARQEGEDVRFSVADRGPGIDPAHLPRVFERLWLAEPEAGGGLGIGLAVARGLVQAHRGRIWAESALGKGSTFFFTLPVEEED
jgi:PAS domain S-box-containing protein